LEYQLLHKKEVDFSTIPKIPKKLKNRFGIERTKKERKTEKLKNEDRMGTLACTCLS